MVSLPQNDLPPVPRNHGDRMLDVAGAGVLSWVLPGLGHALFGHRRHGVVAGSVVVALWSIGLALGGVSVVDGRPAPTGQRVWFWAQAGVGASVLVERVHASLRLGEDPPTLALGRAREVATLYLAVAGLLNMMVAADAMRRAAKAPPAPASLESPQAAGLGAPSAKLVHGGKGAP